MEETVVVVLCGGRSVRFPGANKLFVYLKDKPVFVHTLLAFKDFPVVLVIPNGERMIFAQYLECYNLNPYKIVYGGRNRQESVINAVKELDGFKYIAVHDGARPLISKKDINNVIKDAKTYSAAVLGVPVKDTIKSYTSTENGLPLNSAKLTTFDRKNLYAIQTPQVFEFNLYKKEILCASEEYTDDAQIFENANLSVHLTIGSYSNIKITTKEDIAVAEAYMSNGF
ncbi:MAG: 2-C-methyl-D-erythritol 4-phosphate cytidylyltransferase [Oscillospiraceae bacterium]|jgi:2-C-methyl-D-erythritol 4-phosphate cytidylyltransferase|nr:2-C-methyl-D-erythritol 4-phosphate cytidylyltransferase [Oscillospiraceae bacterium]